MRNLRYPGLILIISALLMLGLAGCSSDDSTEPVTADSTPPVVIEFDPGDGEVGVNLSEEIEIQFSEAIDQATVAGQVTISSGTILNQVWTSANVLEISHTPWAEATEITVTVGTGVKDIAGNALPQAFSVSFFTMSSTVVLILSDPYDTEVDVLRNVTPILQFSHDMNGSSVAAAITITDDTPVPPKVVPDWDLVDLYDDNKYRIEFVDLLTAENTYHIVISTAAMCRYSSDHLEAETEISFTVGDEIDSTPPVITSVSPAVGATVNPSQNVTTITFSKPIDEANMEPSRLAGQLMACMAAEPTWNAAGTEITLYLDTPLPAGVRFFVVFGPGTFHDLVGNPNVVADSLSFTVSGDPDYWPVNGDIEYHFDQVFVDYSPEWGMHSGDTDLMVLFEDISGETFERVEYEMEDGWVVDDCWLMRRNSSGVHFRGFVEDDGDVMFSPEIEYLPLPTPSTWDGNSEITMGEMTVDLEFSGEVLDRDGALGPLGEDPAIYFEDCLVVELYHGMRQSDGGDLFSAGTDTIWYAPGIGMVKMNSFEEEIEEGEWDWSETILRYTEMISDR